VGVRAAHALPRPAAMHRDAFLTDQAVATTVRLDEHRGDQITRTSSSTTRPRDYARAFPSVTPPGGKALHLGAPPFVL
jgi:hypothetical protein